MNKSDLIDAVSERTGLAKSDSARAIDAVLGTITETLQSGDTVTLPGFGSFVVRTRAERSGRNPRTGEERATENGRHRDHQSRCQRWSIAKPHDEPGTSRDSVCS